MITIGRHMKPFEFWPYTTTVYDRLYEYEPDWLHGEGGDPCGRRAVNELRADLLQRFTDAGIKCELDNKIAFGLLDETNGQVLYIGFYDGRVSMGRSVKSDGWNKPSRAVKEG